MTTLRALFILGVFVLYFAAETSACRHKKSADQDHCKQTPKVVTVEQVTEPVFHGEGPHWDHESQKLYYVNIINQTVHCLDPSTGEVTYTYIANGPVGFVIPVQGSPNQFVAGAGRELVWFGWDSTTNSTEPVIRVLTKVDQDKPNNRFNDAKVDSHGRLFAGTMGPEHGGQAVPDQGTLYLIGENYEPVVKISPVTISNGLAWSSDDKTMYYIDTPTKKIVSYDFDSENATISNRQVAYDVANFNTSGVPDGLTIDTNGDLWAALYWGQGMISVNPNTREMLKYIRIPATQITSAAFGGHCLDILYVTTSRNGLTEEQKEEQPSAGAVFAVRGLGVRGTIANKFKLLD